MNLINLPEPLISLISDFLWGTNLDYKKKFQTILLDIKVPARLDILNQINYQHRNNVFYEEIEDDLYCPGCGEKNLFPFTRFTCWDCEPNGSGVIPTIQIL